MLSILALACSVKIHQKKGPVQSDLIVPGFIHESDCPDLVSQGQGLRALPPIMDRPRSIPIRSRTTSRVVFQSEGWEGQGSESFTAPRTGGLAFVDQALVFRGSKKREQDQLMDASIRFRLGEAYLMIPLSPSLHLLGCRKLGGEP